MLACSPPSVRVAAAAAAQLRRVSAIAGRRGLASKAVAGPAAVAAASRAHGTAAAQPVRDHPLCLSDRAQRKLLVRGKEVPVDASFWDYVADEQSVRDASVYKNNTENYMGTVKYPLGVMGPLRVNGQYANREYIVPMATHEGALLASYDRGAKAATLAGGITTRIKGRCMLRAPVFCFANVAEATDFARFADTEETRVALKRAVEAAVENVTVMHVRSFQTDRKVHVSIGVDTRDAAGQTMVMYAGEVVMQYMKDRYPGKIAEMFVEGGFNSDKRVSILHTLLGKGHSVVADCVIPKAIVEKVLHTTPYRLQRFQKMHNRTNEFIGGLSCTAHVANGLTAFFLATGNDPACVAESQAAVTHFDVHGRNVGSDLENCDLYASMTLNSLIVASIGGGTGLPAFKAARSMMDIKSSNELAEVCAAVALSGEMSFYAAMESGEFSKAHWNMTHKGH